MSGLALRHSFFLPGKKGRKEMRLRNCNYFCGVPSTPSLFHDSPGYSHRDSGGGGGIIKCKLQLYEYAERRGRRLAEREREDGGGGRRERALEKTIEERGAKSEGVLRRPECLAEREAKRRNQLRIAIGVCMPHLAPSLFLSTPHVAYREMGYLSSLSRPAPSGHGARVHATQGPSHGPALLRD